MEDTPGRIVFRASGAHAATIFNSESGGHRWQRIPPTERRDRVHTSTITVAVLEDQEVVIAVVREGDLEIKTCRSGGAGGQNVNKTNSAVQVRHLPTGLMVRRDCERDQSTNRREAIAEVRRLLATSSKDRLAAEVNRSRREQVGSGMRGDKMRTIRVRDDRVTDHNTNRRTTYTKYSRGDFSDLL